MAAMPKTEAEWKKKLSPFDTGKYKRYAGKTPSLGFLIFSGISGLMWLM